MKTEDLISIVMPVYNAEAYLPECLDSILEQEYEGWELLAVDDFSADGSRAVLDAYAERDSRISVYRGVDKGIIPALRLAYSKVRGRYVTRMDADDIMSPQKLSLLLHQLQSTDCDVAVGKVSYFSTGRVLADGYTRYAHWLNTLIDDSSHFNSIYQECVIPSPCWMMDRSTLDSIGGFEADRYPEDYDLTFRMYANGLKVRGVADIIHLWRDHDSRASRNDEHYSDQSFLPLKLHYLAKLELQDQQPLLLWGAGSAGKSVAKHLLGIGVGIRWVTNNPNKIGRDIYGVVVESADCLSTLENHVVVVAVRTRDFHEDNAALLDQLRDQNKVLRFY